MINRKPLLQSILIVLFLFLISSFEDPKGWSKGAGKDSEKYEVGIEIGAGLNGTNAAS